MRAKEKNDTILSAGIDVGTTSCHVTVSRLQLSNQSRINQAPRLCVSQAELVYQSPIFFTPLTDEGLIDGEEVTKLIEGQYAQAGIAAWQVQTGAAIVTGESARRRNAETVIRALAELSGDFVVASAGPHLESILAARGSGAARASRARQNTICNIDIGGGTTNAAVFACGELLDCACLTLGGRVLRLSPSGELLSLSQSGDVFLEAIGKPLAPGTKLSPEFLARLGHLIAETITGFFHDPKLPPLTQRLLNTEPLRKDYQIDEYWFSGGVAEIMKDAPRDPLVFCDMGVYLAAGLLSSLSQRKLPFHIPPSPIRATVIGAGTHSLQLSGSTIRVEADALPLKNLPVIRPFKRQPQGRMIGAAAAGDEIRRSLAQNDLDWKQTPLAVLIDDLGNLSFACLNEWARALAGIYLELGGRGPLIIILRQDAAMALGQLLGSRLPEKSLVVIDGIDQDWGDYVDIGSPLGNRLALPVVLKDLVFRS